MLAGMAKSDATTVDEYLTELPPGRREVIKPVRKVVLEHLSEGYEETMQYGHDRLRYSFEQVSDDL